MNCLLSITNRSILSTFCRSFFLAFFLISFFPSIAWSGSWVPKVGSGYHKVGFNYFEATKNFGEDERFEKFTNRSITYYGEVGVAKNLGLFTSVPFQDLEQTFDGEKTDGSGIGDVELGLRYNWFANPFVFSTALTFKLPYFYDEDDVLPLGNGQEDYELRALLGRSLGKFGYFGLEGGYRFRAGDPSDEYRYLIEYGFSIAKDVYFRTKLDGIESAKNASGGISSVGNLSVTPEFNLGKLEVTTGWNFSSPANSSEGTWGTEFTWTKDLYGSNTLEGSTFQLAVVYQH